MSKHWRGAAAVCTILTLGLLAVGCGGSDTNTANSGNGNSTDTVDRSNKGMVESTEKPITGGKLVYALTAETNGWNPATNQWHTSGLIVAHQIFDTLAAFNDKAEIKPFLLESWDHNPDFTVWTFKIRPGVKLSNGKPANADVVVRNQNYLKNSPVTGPAFKYSGVTAITKVDDLSWTVSLSKTTTDYPLTYATQLGVVVDPDWLESNDGLSPIGTGPFTLDKWEIGNRLIVRKNPDYWRKDANGVQMPYLDAVEFRMIPDTDARSKALQAKDVDVIQTFAGQQVQDFQTANGVQVYSNAAGENRENFVMLNTQQKPFDNLDARRALAYATDKKAYGDVVSGGFDELANGFLAPNSPWFAKTDYPQYDPVKAKELVEKVKAANGGTFEFTLEGADEPETRLGAQTLQAQWAAVGIDTKINLTENAKLIIGIISGQYQASLFNQFDEPNPYATAPWFDPSLAVAPPALTLNFARNNDPAIGAAFRAGTSTTDEALQKAQMKIVQERLAADVPYIWLLHIRESLIASDRVVNLMKQTLPDGEPQLDLNQGSHSLSQVWMKP